MISDLSEKVNALTEILLKKGYSLSLAESCTGGLISSMITEIPGASAFFAGCAVTYSYESKEELLDVSHETLMDKGAVSEETANEMSFGALLLFDTDIAAAVTGIAGPDGGTDAKPVGTVFISVTDGERTECRKLSLNGSRSEVRYSAAEELIDLLTEFLGAA
jgi:PncC family amidohydrolase